MALLVVPFSVAHRLLLKGYIGNLNGDNLTSPMSFPSFFGIDRLWIYSLNNNYSACSIFYKTLKSVKIFELLRIVILGARSPGAICMRKQQAASEMELINNRLSMYRRPSIAGCFSKNTPKPIYSDLRIVPNPNKYTVFVICCK